MTYDGALYLAVGNKLAIEIAFSDATFHGVEYSRQIITYLTVRRISDSTATKLFCYLSTIGSLVVLGVGCVLVEIFPNAPLSITSHIELSKYLTCSTAQHSTAQHK